MLSELFYPYMLGGAERRYFEIARRLAKRHEVTVYASRLRGSSDKEDVEGIKIIRTGLRHPADRRSFLPLAVYFRNLLRSFGSRYDVVDANQGIASFAGLAKLMTKQPVVATFHDIYWDKWGDHFSFPYSGVGKFMEFAWSKLKYSAVIANSPETKERLWRLGFSAPVETVVSGVDVGVIRKARSTKEKRTVVYVGRLEKYKGVDSLIRAVAGGRTEFPGIRLRIIGSGSEEQRLRNMAKELGVDVEFLGFVDERKKFETIKSSSVLVNPSYVEGLGLIALEAMACGVPVIVRDLKCYFFCNNENSVKFRDDSGLEDAIMKILSSPNAARKMVKSGLVTSRKYSWDETARKVEELYKKCVG